MKKILIVIFLFLFISFLLPVKAFAADLNIECFGTGTCIKTGVDPLFSLVLDGYWLPGNNVSKTFKLTNSASETREAFLKPLRTSDMGILEDVMEISLFPTGGGAPNWSGILSDFYNLDNFSLGNISSGGNAEYIVTARMKPEADNKYQGKSTKFDLNFSFWVEQEATVTPTPTTAPGTVLGDGISTFTCSDAKPELLTNLLVIPGPGLGQVSLSWTPPVLPYTYFLIAYSDNSSWPPKWGNPDVGNVTSYIVSGLGSGTYYFWLRAGNGCTPGDFVGPVSSGVVMGISGAGIATGFVPGVLGVTEEEQGEIENGTIQEGEVAGVSLSMCPWGKIFLIFWFIVIIILIIWYLKQERKPEMLKKIIILIIPFVLWIIDRYFHQWYAPTIYCQYLLLLTFIFSGLFYLFATFKKNNPSS